MAIPGHATFTSEEYIHLELFSQEKHEFFEGVIVAMAGASYAHIQIQSNVLRQIGNHFETTKKSCEILASDLRVKANDLKYFYPDLTVICDKPQYDDSSKSLLNPQGIIEILSPATKSFDAEEKLFAYRGVSSLTEIVLIDSAKRSISVHERRGAAAWEMRETTTQSACQMFGCDLALDTIYRNSGV